MIARRFKKKTPWGIMTIETKEREEAKMTVRFRIQISEETEGKQFSRHSKTASRILLLGL